jgi:uncharacterized protein
MRHAFYLHGFASSPDSTKAALFAERLAAAGVALHCPDLNAPDFERLTVSRMIAQVEAAMAALEPGPVSVMGSSLGGFVAYHLAARQRARPGGVRAGAHPIDRLVLLAPAFDFGKSSFSGMTAADVERWRVTDRHEFFHYAENRPRQVRFALYEDAQRYDSELLPVDVPMLIFQGARDTIVEPAMVQRVAAARPSAAVRLVDDGHQLSSCLGLIWSETAAFLGLAGR